MSLFERLQLPLNKNVSNFLFFILSILIVSSVWLKGNSHTLPVIAGCFILVSSCYLVLYFFLSHFRPEVLKVSRKIFFIIITILSFILLTVFVQALPDDHLLFLIPFAIVPVVIRTFYDARLAVFTMLTTLILSGFLVPEPFEFVFLNFITGMVAIFSLTNMYHRSRLFITSLLVFVSYSVIYTGLNLVHYGNLSNVTWISFVIFAVNGLLVLSSYPLIFIFETRFYFLSDATLLELADTNQPLLRKLSEQAPGTFQHSLQVAHLSEEAARIIGANALMVRAGALYHDIGKIAGPSYFVENKSDNKNPHDHLEPEQSAKLIINHVSSGVILAKNYKLPVQIIDFIRTHQGTAVSYYFYKKYTDLHPWDTSRENEFTYPGPKPFSKETAIVMMADSVEAASRSLETYSEYNISDLVDRIISVQEHDGQLSEAPLTFKEISAIKEIFKKRLQSIYHARIVYPERKS